MDKPKRGRSTLGRVIALLSARDRRNLTIVLIVSLIAALIDVLGVGSIAPFLAVASNPDIIEKNPILHDVYQLMGFQSSQSFLLALGLGVIVFLIVTGSFKAMTRYTVVRFTNQARHKLTMRLMEGYLRQEYSFFLRRNSHEFVRIVTAEVQAMVQGTLMTFVEMVGFGLQLLFLVTLLLVTNPIVTLIGAGLIGGVYGAIYQGLRMTSKKLGQKRFDLNQERNRVVSETFWGIKDTKLLGAEKAFLGQYEIPSEQMARNESNAELVGDIPKYALEAFAFTAIVAFVLVLIAQTGSFQNAAVTVGLFAFAAYRMIPSVQNLFKDVTKMRYAAPSANKVCQEFEELDLAAGSLAMPQERLSFLQKLELRDLVFQYAGSVGPVLRGLSLSVGYRQTVGFAGPTGSGKTTLIDLVLGLLRPVSGQIVIDGVVLDDENRRSWQSCIGYVPQAIYLSNASVAQNIAFGVPEEQIDLGQLERAARLAQIHDFIVTGLPAGYQTDVGERGIRLSGGQRQRLGIARALYRNPDVLVFDEATSALDNETEAAVMEAVRALSGRVTLLMIAHRLTTLKGCDSIFILDSGQVVDNGTYDELKKRRPDFFQERA